MTEEQLRRYNEVMTNANADGLWIPCKDSTLEEKRKATARIARGGLLLYRACVISICFATYDHERLKDDAVSALILVAFLFIGIAGAALASDIEQ